MVEGHQTAQLALQILYFKIHLRTTIVRSILMTPLVVGIQSSRELKDTSCDAAALLYDPLRTGKLKTCSTLTGVCDYDLFLRI